MSKVNKTLSGVGLRMRVNAVVVYDCKNHPSCVSWDTGSNSRSHG